MGTCVRRDDTVIVARLYHSDPSLAGHPAAICNPDMRLNFRLHG